MEHTLFPASWEALLAQYEKRGASKEVLKTARTILAELYAAGIGHGKSSSRNALCLTLHEGGYIPIQFVETNPSSGFAIVFDCKSNGELRYSQVIPDEYAIMEKERCIDNRLLSIEAAVKLVIELKSRFRRIDELLSSACLLG